MGDIFVRYSIVLASTTLLIVIGVNLFKVYAGGNYFLFWFVLTIGALTFIVLGFVLTALVKNTNSMMMLGMAILFPFMFLGVCFWPLDKMPPFLRPICEVLPTLHLNTALRTIVMRGAGANEIWHEFPFILSWLIGYSILAIELFKWE